MQFLTVLVLILFILSELVLNITSHNLTFLTMLTGELTLLSLHIEVPPGRACERRMVQPFIENYDREFQQFTASLKETSSKWRLMEHSCFILKSTKPSIRMVLT